MYSVIIVLLVVLAVAAIYWIGALRQQSDEKRIKAERSGESVETFLSCYEYDAEVRSVARTVYEVIRKDFSRDFPIRPGDRIENELFLFGDCLEDLLEGLLSRYGFSLGDALSAKERLPVITVNDLIRLILFLRKLPDPSLG